MVCFLMVVQAHGSLLANITDLFQGFLRGGTTGYLTVLKICIYKNHTDPVWSKTTLALNLQIFQLENKIVYADPNSGANTFADSDPLHWCLYCIKIQNTIWKKIFS